MKRDEVEAILNNEDLDVSGKVNEILNLRGAESRNAEKRYSDLDAKYQAAISENERYKDYDAVLQERDALRAEKADRAMNDRFTAVVGENKFLNAYTADGVKKAFTEAVALPENEGKTDAEIYAAMSDGKEAEWYQSSVGVRMTPSAGRVDLPDQRQAYLDEKYANSKFYEK